MVGRSLGRRSRSAWVAFAGAALLVLAAFLPWSAAVEGHAHSGFDLVDGYVTFGTGVLVVAVVYWRAWRRDARIAVALASLVALWLFAKWHAGIAAATAYEPAIGLYGTLLGGLLVLASALFSLVDPTANREAPRIARIEARPDERDGDETD